MIWLDDDFIQDDGADHVAQAVHGPYDPAVFYGKKDLPLREVNFLKSFPNKNPVWIQFNVVQ